MRAHSEMPLRAKNGHIRDTNSLFVYYPLLEHLFNARAPKIDRRGSTSRHCKLMALNLNLRLFLEDWFMEATKTPKRVKHWYEITFVFFHFSKATESSSWAIAISFKCPPGHFPMILTNNTYLTHKHTDNKKRVSLLTLKKCNKKSWDVQNCHGIFLNGASSPLPWIVTRRVRACGSFCNTDQLA